MHLFFFLLFDNNTWLKSCFLKRETAVPSLYVFTKKTRYCAPEIYLLNSVWWSCGYFNHRWDDWTSTRNLGCESVAQINAYELEEGFVVDSLLGESENFFVSRLWNVAPWRDIYFYVNFNFTSKPAHYLQVFLSCSTVCVLLLMLFACFACQHYVVLWQHPTPVHVWGIQWNRTLKWRKACSCGLSHHKAHTAVSRP